MTLSFEYVDVKKELVKVLTEELPKFGFGAVKVIKADPQSPAEIPCIGINRIDDNEAEMSLVDSHAAHYDKDTKEYTNFYGTFFQEAMEIRIWHTNGDAREKLFIHLKAILFSLRTNLVEKGLLNITLRSGRDEQDTTQAQAPMALYWSTITMSYLNPLDIKQVSIEEPISGFQAITNLPIPTEGGGAHGNPKP